MRFLIMLSALFLSFSSTAYADLAEPEDSGPATEESEEDTAKEEEGEEGGCSNVNMSDLSLIMLPVIGLAVASRRR